MVGGWILLLVAAAGGTLPRPLAPLEQAAIAAAVKEELRDPDSAQFSWPPLRERTVYCGAVNAKNGYGGYSGRQPFAVFVEGLGASVRPVEPARVLLGGRSGQADRLIYLACSDPEKDGRLDVAPRVGD